AGGNGQSRVSLRQVQRVLSVRRLFGGFGSEAPSLHPLDAAALFEATPRGWKFRGAASQRSPVVAYLLQLEEEGRALNLDGQLVIPWEDVCTLETDDAHASSLPLLGLPPVASERMALSSQGSPTDPEFR